tara:strand:+ start:1374 stop:2267 length:894 start_codon:yes stop_codon:yes gene_type:complete
LKANLFCFLAAFSWSLGFPSGERLMESWDLLSLVVLRLVPGTFALLIFWRLVEGRISVGTTSWIKGVIIGGGGFGLGTTLLLYGQKQSSPVTPAVAAAMMPVAGALLEVFFDNKQISITFLMGLIFAVIGGLVAAGVRLDNYTVNIGFFWCLSAVCLYAWATHETNRRLSELSSLGQTVITLIGAAMFVSIILSFANFIFPAQRQYGSFDIEALILMLIFSILSVSISQPFWIAGTRGLGIALSSFHLNAVPFYVMTVLVILGDDRFDLFKLFGIVLIAIGVFLAQRKSSLKNKLNT